MRNPITAEVHNLEASVAPDENNDVTEGYRPGSIWVDQVAEDVYTCIASPPGAAIWLSQRLGTTVGA